MMQVSLEEAQVDSANWPHKDSLAAVQQQCVALSYDVSGQHFSAHKLVKKLCSNLLCILHLSTEFQVSPLHEQYFLLSFLNLS